MFENRKLRQDIQLLLEQQAKGADRILAAIEELKKGGTESIGELSGRVEASRTAILRHDASLEEFLSELEEESGEEKVLSEQLKSTESERDGLLALVGVYEEQLWELADRLTGEEWDAQFAILDRRLEQAKRPLGLVTVARAGVPVDYDIHEVIQVIAAENQGQDGMVCEVLIPGIIWKGKTLKKARVSVWRYEEPAEETEDE